MTRDELVAALDARLRQATSSGTPQVVLVPEAVAEAAQLAALVEPDRDDVQAARSLGTFYLLRFLHSPKDLSEQDGRAALLWFERVLPWQPEAVPSALIEMLAEHAPPAGDDADSWSDEAVRLLESVAASSVAVLDRATALLERAVAAIPPDDPTRAAYLTNLGNVLRARFQRTGELTDIDQAVAVLRGAVSTAPPGHPNRAAYLTNLGAALGIRFERAADLADLDEAIRVGREAVATAAPDDPSRTTYLTNLGTALQRRFGRTRDLADLDEAITAGREAVSATPPAHPNKAVSLASLAAGMQARFGQTWNLADLGQAITALREAVSATPPNHPNRTATLAILGNALRTRFERAGTLADLDQAITVLAEAATITPADHANRAATLSDLAVALRARFERTGNLVDLDEAIALGREAVTATPRDHPDRAATLSNLGIALQARFGRTGSLVDLDQAIALGREAVVTTPPDHPNRATYLSNLGIALQARFERTGNLADLDQAVSVLREAMTNAEPGPSRARHLANLGTALRARFERAGDLADLDQTIALGREAVATTPPDHPDRAPMLSGLGTALAIRFVRSKDLADLDQAISVLAEAVTITPPDHPGVGSTLSDLGNALHARFVQSEHLGDLERSIALGQEAVTATPTGHPNRAGRLTNLCITLRTRFERTGNLADLDQAIAVGREAVISAPPNHPERAAMLLNLGTALQKRFERAGNEADIEEAIAHLGAGLGLVPAAAAMRVRCGNALGWLLGGRDWVRASRVWDLVLDLQPLVLDRLLSRDDRQHMLREFSNVGTVAAATRLALDDVAGAWEVLEAGRGMLLGQALETTPEPDLRRAYPDLADQVDRLRHDLNVDTTIKTLPGDTGVPAQGAADVRRRAAQEWADLLMTIRGRSGFDRFGLHSTLDELRRGVGNGTVVAVNVTRWRCDALVLTASGAQVLPLPGLTEDEAVDRANQFLAATRDPGNRSNQVMRETLAWLWDTVTGPILEHLGHTQPPPPDESWPRVWWSPTGPLTVLPLHAAGHRDDDGLAVLDRVISSYTPTVKLLARARQAMSRDFIDEGGLVVGIDSAPGYPPLAFAADEARRIHGRCGPRARSLVDSDATLAAVRGGLADSRWAHLACHGVPGRDPSDSHLVLWDGPLPVREIANLDLQAAYLAYLSACTTAFGGTTLLDEAIHIASAFQVAGFAHVVATLWSISDYHAPRLAEDFYQHLSTGAQPAWAVHEAVRALRDERRDAPFLWAPYVHFGP